MIQSILASTSKGTHWHTEIKTNCSLSIKKRAGHDSLIKSPPAKRTGLGLIQVRCRETYEVFWGGIPVMLRQLYLFHEMEESSVNKLRTHKCIVGSWRQKTRHSSSRCANMIGVVLEFLSNKTGIFMFLSKTIQDETHETETQQVNLM